MDTIKLFRQKIKERDYIQVAKLYHGYAWKYRSEFNLILDANNIREGIIDIMYQVCDPSYTDQQ